MKDLRNVCPKCFSTKFRKSGFRKLGDGSKRQRYACKKCGHILIFGENGFRKMKNSPQNIILALSLIQRGVSYRDVASHLSVLKRLKIHHTTIFKWDKKFMQFFASELSKKRGH